MLGPVVRKGDVVTDFELPDETGAPRRLSGLLADGPVVLFFYPAAMSLGCTVESCHFRDLIGEFKAVGAQPVGISADTVERQRHFADKHSLGYPLLSDSDQVVARQFGVRGWIPMMPLRRVTLPVGPARPCCFAPNICSSGGRARRPGAGSTQKAPALIVS